MTKNIIIIAFTLICVCICGISTSPVNSNKRCESCKAIVSFASKVRSFYGERSLMNILTRFCNDNSQLPGVQSMRMCSFMMEDVMKMFKNANHETFCDEISMCDASDDKIDVNMKVTVGDNATCQFCQTIVTNVKDILSGQSTEQEIKTVVGNVCHYLGNFEKECIGMIDEYLDTLFNFIRTALQPLQFCQSIGACPKQSVRKEIENVADIMEIVNIFPAQMPNVPLPEVESDERERESDNIECLLCKRIVTLVIQELKDNRTEDAIIAALDKICMLFPKHDRDKCNTFVQQYTDELIHILTEETDPEMACTLLGVCAPQSVRKLQPNLNEKETKEQKWIEIRPAEHIGPDVELVSEYKYCYECEMIMHFLKNEVSDLKTQKEIEDFVENELCDRMKVVMIKEACDSFVDSYGPSIIRTIVNKVFDPKLVCQNELNLCPHKQTPIEVFQKPSLKSEKCDLCIELIKRIDSLLENEEFEKETSQIIERICNVMPKNKQIQCESMIEAFGPYFMQMIGQMSDPSQICKSVDMCLTPGHVNLLGGHKCTFGPTYWCHTIAHAESCKATDFCKSKVWKPIS